jgi:hypothetical protein
MSKNETGDKTVPPELPWLNVDLFRKFIKETNVNDATKWFMETNEGFREGLMADARRRHREKQLEEHEKQQTEFNHAVGTVHEGEFANESWLVVLRQPFDANNTGDPRIQLAAKTLSLISDHLTLMDRCQGSKEASAIISSHLTAIQMTAMADEGMIQLLGNGLEYDPKENRAVAGLQVANELGLPAPETLQGQGADVRNALKQHFIDMKDFFADLKRVIKRRQYEYTPTDAERIKELGIARKVPEIQYVVQESSYPGGGYVSNEQLSREHKPKFIITFAPTNELLAEKGIPKDLVEEFHLQHLHGSYPHIEGMPSIGWVGGFVDPDERSMYVYEVQSDLMQNTNQMRDVRKVEEERKVRRQQLEEERNRIEQQIEEVKQQALAPQRPKDPRAGLRGKIRRIDNDIAQAEASIQEMVAANEQMEAQPGFDPSMGQYQHNKNLIDTRLKQLQKFKAQKQRMEENLARIPAPPRPEQPEPTENEQTPEGAQVPAEAPLNQQQQARVDKLEQRLQQIDTEIAQTRERLPNYERPKWHDYRNVVENTFKDWVRLFWNTAVREAKRNNMAFLYIITADELMNLWRSFGRSSKKDLFTRVYDNTGQFYNAEVVNKKGRNFWRVNLNDPALRVASNWFGKAFHNLAKFGSNIPELQPRQILSASGSATIPAFILSIPTHETASVATV